MINISHLILTILPMYIANASALLFGNGKTPLDLNLKFWDNKPLFGKGKTIKGTIAGIICGSFAGYFIYYLNFGFPYYLEYSFMASLGAILGDLAGSFIKRRLNIERGKDLFLLDQLDFVIGGLALTYYLNPLNIQTIILIMLLTIFMHKLTNYIAYVIKIKGVPW